MDFYVVTSREEGGPMALMESMACGVPVVSTMVGMASDLLADGISGGLAHSEDVAGIATRALKILSLGEEELSELKAKATQSVQCCDWGVVGRRHWQEVYQPLLYHATD